MASPAALALTVTEAEAPGARFRPKLALSKLTHE
jgi:hypothetical protein